MSAALNVVRIFIAVLGILFAFQLGKVVADLKARGLPVVRASTWFLRVLVIVFAIFWVGGFDAITIATIVLAAAAFATGIWQRVRRKPDKSVHLNLQ